MSILRHPVPMLSPWGWGASTESWLPINAHLREALESLDSSYRALECFEIASIFLLHKVASCDGAVERHHRKYSVHLERILNWSFTVAQKSVFHWGQQDIQHYLDFVKSPDSSWVCSSSFSRFVSNKYEPYEQWRINERWKPFRRKIQDGAVMPPCWGSLDKERTIVLDFFHFLSQRASSPLAHLNVEIVGRLRREIPTKRPSRSLRREYSDNLFKMTESELDWVFEKADEFSNGNWQFELVLFAMAIMRYSNVPLRTLCRAPHSAGLLSQFYRQSGEWYFVNNLNESAERSYKFDAQIDLYIHRYFRYLELDRDEPLPDTHIFRRPVQEQGFGYDYLTKMVENFRYELCQLVENYRDSLLIIRQEMPRKFSLSVIRKSRSVPLLEKRRRA